MQTVSRDGISYYMGFAYEPVSLNDQFFDFLHADEVLNLFQLSLFDAQQCLSCRSLVIKCLILLNPSAGNRGTLQNGALRYCNWFVAVETLRPCSHHGAIRGTSLREVGSPILDCKATTPSWLAGSDDSAYMAQHNYIRPSAWSVRSHVASVGSSLAIGQ